MTWDKDTRTVCAGAALALTCGVMLGGAMQPDLGYDGRPAGPQQITGLAGLRSTGPFDTGPMLTSYSGPVPDYVLGTDWKKTVASPSEPAAVSPPAARRTPVRDDEDGLTTEELKAAWAAPVSRPVYADDEPPPPRPYPSQGGGTAVGAPDPETAPAAG